MRNEPSGSWNRATVPLAVPSTGWNVPVATGAPAIASLGLASIIASLGLASIIASLGLASIIASLGLASIIALLGLASIIASLGLGLGLEPAAEQAATTATNANALAARRDVRRWRLRSIWSSDASAGGAQAGHPG